MYKKFTRVLSKFSLKREIELLFSDAVCTLNAVWMNKIKQGQFRNKGIFKLTLNLVDFLLIMKKKRFNQKFSHTSLTYLNRDIKHMRIIKTKLLRKFCMNGLTTMIGQ